MLQFATGSIIFHRARAAVPDFLPAPAALLLRPSAFCCCKADSPHRQLQLVQSTMHAAVLAAVRRCGLQRLLPRGLVRLRRSRRTCANGGQIFVAAVALLIVFCSLVQMDVRFGGSPPVRRGQSKSSSNRCTSSAVTAVRGHDHPAR
jgi:hypothetical protein